MRQKKASNTWRSGHNHFWISVSCHVSGWGQNQNKKKISRVILEMSTDSNNKICSGKVWNLPLRNLPAKKRIIRTWHGTTLLRIRFFPWRRQRVTRNWMWISSNPNNFKLTCYKWVFKTTEYLAFEQAFLGALAAGREKEGELLRLWNFEFHLRFPRGSPSAELSDFHQSALSGNERESKQTLKNTCQG